MEFYSNINDVRMRGLPAPSPSDDEIVHALKLAKTIIDSWCLQNFENSDCVTITADGNGGDRYIFGSRIRNVIIIYVNGYPIPHHAIVVSNPAIGEIALKHGYKFTEGIANISLDASTGWLDIPLPVAEAAAHIAAMIINRQLFSGSPNLPELESESILDYSRKRFSPAHIKGIIEQDPYLFELLRPFRLKGVTA